MPITSVYGIYSVFFYSVIKKSILCMICIIARYKSINSYRLIIMLIMCFIPFSFAYLYISSIPFHTWDYLHTNFDERIATEVTKDGSKYGTNRAINAEFESYKTKIQNNDISYNEVSNNIRNVLSHLEGARAATRLTIHDLVVVKYVSSVSPFSFPATFELKGLGNGLECDNRNFGNTRCLLTKKRLIINELRTKLAERGMRVDALLN